MQVTGYRLQGAGYRLGRKRTEAGRGRLFCRNRTLKE